MIHVAESEAFLANQHALRTQPMLCANAQLQHNQFVYIHFNLNLKWNVNEWMDAQASDDAELLSDFKTISLLLLFWNACLCAISIHLCV